MPLAWTGLKLVLLMNLLHNALLAKLTADPFVSFVLFVVLF
jgi:hypothetical protein